MKSNKIKLGQFFTKENYWERKSVMFFYNLYKKNIKVVVDPFAGAGDLLCWVKNIETIGYDIDANFDWEVNDSLQFIPQHENGFILTNPPYLSKVSSVKNKIFHKSFEQCNHSDLYLIALEKMLKSKMPGIAIVPESFINSTFDKKHIFSITILIPNPFKDTDVPVCIITFDPNVTFNDTLIYKNDDYISTLAELQNKANAKLVKQNGLEAIFNSNEGELALVAYDSSDGKQIRFMHANDLKYKRQMKISSRVITKIKINTEVTDRLITSLNNKITEYRTTTYDVLLTPFRGNTKVRINNEIQRRRRLDYRTARQIINSINLNDLETQ